MYPSVSGLRVNPTNLGCTYVNLNDIGTIQKPFVDLYEASSDASLNVKYLPTICGDRAQMSLLLDQNFTL